MESSSHSSKGKSKKKFGLKWFFTAPFKTGKERRPDMEEISDLQSVGTDSDGLNTKSDSLSSKGPEHEPREKLPSPHTSEAPLAITDRPRKSS